MGGVTVLVATLGFTADFSLRRIAELSGEGGLRKVILVGLRSDDATWRRAESTFSLASRGRRAPRYWCWTPTATTPRASSQA